jgi:uncharacterized membrane protein YfcA
MESLWAVITVMLIAIMVKALFGFGEALVAVPLLTLFIGVKTATPLVALMTTTTTALLVWQNRRNIDIASVWRLILAAVIGVPFGVYFLRVVPEAIVTKGLGIILILFGAYFLLQPFLLKKGTGPNPHQGDRLKNERWAYGFGFIAGILGGAYTVGGPPVILYGTLRGWSPEQFRAGVQSSYLPISILTLISHGASGLWTVPVLQTYLLMIPIGVIATTIGNRLSHRVPTQQFRVWVYGLLVVLGNLMLVR